MIGCKASVLGAICLAMFLTGVARAQGPIRDDRIPWGPAGTIGRGTDTPPGRGWRWDGASGSWLPPGSAPRSPWPFTILDIRVARAPYPTNQFYEPGDGYRYPLYYDPGTRSYVYYPAPRQAEGR